MSWVRPFAIALFLALLAAAPARAQEADAEALLETGIRSQTSGQHRLAVQTLTRALNAESLTGEQVAKALYYRGLAYKEISRPEQAITDLTGALFLKGLNEKERAQAEQVRTAAFRDGGTASVASAGRAGEGGDTQTARADVPSFSTRVGQAPVPSRTPAPEPVAPAPAPPVFSTSVREEPKQKVAAAPPAPTTSFSTRVDTPPARPQPAPPPPTLRTTIAPSEPPPAPASRPSSAPPAAAPSWSTSVDQGQAPAQQAAQDEPGGTRLGRFFSNIADNITGSDPPASNAPATQWVETKVEPARQQTASAPPPAAQPRAAPAPQPAPAAGGGSGYRIQLAALPSEPEAQASWARLSARHKSLLAGRQPIFQRTDLGSLGIFYRVQIGPFANQTESQRLCNEFKSAGLDCFVSAQ
ncbi:MAG: SPOR domain-containing protein [Pseudomonadota bacterium]|nr:SPOR domain-containing protein [Pseudomonadota bacterium]